MCHRLRAVQRDAPGRFQPACGRTGTDVVGESANKRWLDGRRTAAGLGRWHRGAGSGVALGTVGPGGQSFRGQAHHLPRGPARRHFPDRPQLHCLGHPARSARGLPAECRQHGPCVGTSARRVGGRLADPAEVRVEHRRPCPVRRGSATAPARLTGRGRWNAPERAAQSGGRRRTGCCAQAAVAYQHDGYFATGARPCHRGGLHDPRAAAAACGADPWANPSGCSDGPTVGSLASDGEQASRSPRILHRGRQDVASGFLNTGPSRGNIRTADASTGADWRGGEGVRYQSGPGGWRKAGRDPGGGAVFIRACPTLSRAEGRGGACRSDGQVNRDGDSRSRRGPWPGKQGRDERSPRPS